MPITKSTNFDTKDVIKLVGFAVTITAMWYDLKTDLQVFKATTEIRLSSLEANKNLTSCLSYEAVMPRETKLEDERK